MFVLVQTQKCRPRMKNLASAVLPDQNKLMPPPVEPIDVQALPYCRFAAADLFGTRGDVINKEMPR